ncbi:colicin uptake protein TolR [compost metagenome]
MMSSNNNDKDLNFEINILPILDILSVLICFLLLTAVFVQIGTIDTKQAIGDNSVEGAKNPPSLWVTVEADGTMQLSMRDLPKSQTHEVPVARAAKGVNWVAFQQKIQAIKEKWPELKTGIVRPKEQTSYGDVIKIMDQLKKLEIDRVGLSPLG